MPDGDAGTGRGPILVVDDDRDILDVLRTILEIEGYPVTTAVDGRDALERMIAGETPCVVLLDLMMPRMNGWQFREAQLADPTLAGIPVVVLSGDGDVAIKAGLLRATGWLRKPVDLDVVLATARHYCRR